MEPCSVDGATGSRRIARTSRTEVQVILWDWQNSPLVLPEMDQWGIFMEVIRLQNDDGTFASFEDDWVAQCEQVGDEFSCYATSSVTVMRDFAARNSDKEWAIAFRDDTGRFMAAACAIRTMQKPLAGWTLRVREVTVCPLLDYGILDENAYVDTLIGILNGAIKLSESTLRADHIKLHLRSPADAVFFRAFGNTLDSKGVFAATEAHGAWLTLSKATTLQLAK